MNRDPSPLSGEILEEEVEMTLDELCQVSGLPAEEIRVFVDEGIIEPIGGEGPSWRFRGVSVQRVRFAVTLQKDLGVNRAGAALALELLDELQELRARAQRVE